MIAVLDGERVLLVRHTYGDRQRWELPGGYVHRDEAPAVAARRELREEVGLDLALDDLGVVRGEWDFKHEQLATFAAAWPGGRASYDQHEIAEVAWFPLAGPPASLGPGARAALRRLAARSAS